MGGGGVWTRTRSQHLPPPGTRSQHLPASLPPGLGHNTSLSPRPRSQHLLPPPPGPGHNISLPPPWDQVTTPLPPGLCAGGQYATYWNAFLFSFIFNKLFSLCFAYFTYWINTDGEWFLKNNLPKPER